MKKIVFLIFILYSTALGAKQAAVPAAPYLPAQDTPANRKAPITVQYPQENHIAPAGANNVYLFGKINVPNPILTINDHYVPVHPNGGFIAFLPVEQGNFTFTLTAKSNGHIHQAVRHITVPGKPIEQFIDKARFDSQNIYPSKPLWAMPGQTISLAARGTPGSQVSAAITGLKEAQHISLKEDEYTPGSYTASFTLPLNISPRSAKITYTLYDPYTETRAKITAKERLKILDPKKPLQPARVLDPGVKLRKLPVHSGSLYPFYRAYGQVLIDGRDQGLYHLRLGNGQAAWLEEKKVKFLSPAQYTPNTLPALQTVSSPSSTTIRWSHTRPVPVSIEEFTDRVQISFYYTDTFEENFNFDATSPLLQRITWTEPQDGIITFQLHLMPGQQLWGHSYRYEGNDFVLTLHHQPEIHPTKRKPLRGARILLDAGHSPKRNPPYDGLVSPSGYLEYEANIALAEELKHKLQSAGATVIMTREGDNQMSLPDRYQKALQEQAHIFVSLHHNALPDTANPLAKPLGYSVYYTYPHSFKLAESVHKAFQANIKLPDSGLIQNDVLFIPRIPDIPSILIENAYMILPEQEELVMSKKGRKLFAHTIYQGIVDFYHQINPEAANKIRSNKTKK